MKHITLLAVSFLGLSFNLTLAFSEDLDTSGTNIKYNPHSIKPIPESDILIRRRIWRHIDLKEKANKPFFPHKAELTKFIIEGVEQGLLTPYNDEAFLKPMTKKDFFEKLKLPDAEDLSEDEKSLGFTDDGWKGNLDSKQKKLIDYFLPSEVSILELVEDLMFDKVRSVQLYDIQSIKLIIPANKFETGLRREVGIFKYKDLAEFFEKKKIAWINVNNNVGNIKMIDAFELRLFSSRIIKLENPDDNMLADIYNDTPQASIKAAKELEEELLEQEYFLWEP